MSHGRRNRKNRHRVTKSSPAQCVWGQPPEICKRDHIHAGAANQSPKYSTTTSGLAPAPVTVKPYVPSCKHMRDKFELPEGLHCYGSGWSDMPATFYTDKDTKKGEVLPDIGFYMADNWTRDQVHFTGPVTIPGLDTGPNVMIHYPWQDFGVPENYPQFRVVLEWLVSEIRAGKMVDVGCLGSHGRTGTMLACICVMMGMRPGEAVRYVRANHCKEAIENAKQVDFVVQLADAVRGYQPTDPDDAADNVIVEAERGNCYKESLWSSYKTKAAGSTAASTAAEQYVQVYQGGEWQTVDPKDLADSEVPDSWLTTLVELGFPAPEPWTVLPCCGHEAQEHDTDSGMDVWWCDSMTEGITYCRCEDPVFEGTGSVTDMLDSDVH